MNNLINNVIDAMITSTSMDVRWLLFEDNFLFIYIGQVWDYVFIIGLGMTLIYFLLEVNQKLALEGRDLTMKSFFAPFLKLLIAVAVMANGAKVVSWLLTFNNAFVSYVDSNLTLSLPPNSIDSGVYDAMRDALLNMDIISKVIATLPLLLCWGISLALKIVWIYKAVAYKLEVVWRVGITPIALADVYSCQQSHALRYLKNFLVLGIYAASMIILPRIANTLVLNTTVTVNSLFDIFAAFVQMIMAPFAALGALSLAKTAAKEALGA